MKKSLILGAVAIVGASLTGCNDFLNDNRYPGSTQIVNDEFWSNTANVENQVNYFYQDFLGYGNGTGTGNFYFKWTTDDQCGRTTFAQWLVQNTSPSMSSWNSPYTEIRRANLIIEGVTNGSLSGTTAENYIAMARLHRARQYFALVKCFGDVPLVTKALDPTDDAALYGPRTNRNEVMDYVLEDLNYAIDHITGTGKTVISSDMARAQKAEICLFEASYAKYCQGNAERAQKFYNEVINAAEPIAAKYPICDDYTSLYKSLNGAGGGYNGLGSNSEIIFYKPYAESVLMHSTMDYSCASDGIAGLTRDAFDSFLMLDGTVATDDKGELSADGTSISIEKLLAVRDQRLAMTTYDHLMFHGMTYAGPNTAPMYSETGYGVAKYDNWTFSNADATTANRGWTCAPLFWGARLYLAIAEAKAELGAADDYVTKYIAPLWKRAGFTVVPTKDLLSNINDSNNNMGVSSLIYEIRRCRRCELMMDDDVRYWDLVRWNKLELLDTTKNPKIIQGANVSFVPAEKLNAVTTIGGYLDCSYGQSRIYDKKYNLYPIPTGQIFLNNKLTQNPGWE